MRDSENQKGFRPTDDKGASGSVREVPYDEKEFFQSFYSANVQGAPKDHMTIGWITDPEARFHYNSVENSIIRGVLRRSPPPPNALVGAWRVASQRRAPRLLDVGSGTGHWIDFMRDVFYAKQCIGVELAGQMAAFLREKYAGNPDVTILERNVCDDDFGPTTLGGPVDYVTAIGVMFHIVDDIRWRQALRNLAGCLNIGGLMFVGDEAGAQTRNKEFHHSDSFRTWREFKQAAASKDEVRVSKRVRSIADWGAAAMDAGLRVVDVVRSDREPVITTPENDVIVLEKV